MDCVDLIFLESNRLFDLKCAARAPKYKFLVFRNRHLTSYLREANTVELVSTISFYLSHPIYSFSRKALTKKLFCFNVQSLICPHLHQGKF